MIVIVGEHVTGIEAGRGRVIAASITVVLTYRATPGSSRIQVFGTAITTYPKIRSVSHGEEE